MASLRWPSLSIQDEIVDVYAVNTPSSARLATSACPTLCDAISHTPTTQKNSRQSNNKSRTTTSFSFSSSVTASEITVSLTCLLCIRNFLDEVRVWVVVVAIPGPLFDCTGWKTGYREHLPQMFSCFHSTWSRCGYHSNIGKWTQNKHVALFGVFCLNVIFQKKTLIIVDKSKQFLKNYKTQCTDKLQVSPASLTLLTTSLFCVTFETVWLIVQQQHRMQTFIFNADHSKWMAFEVSDDVHFAGKKAKCVNCGQMSAAMQISANRDFLKILHRQ